jgi:hypothetical protein
MRSKVNSLKSLPKKITIIEPHPDQLRGHGAHQLAGIKSLLSDHGIYGDDQTSLWRHVLTRNPLLIPSLDGSFLPFLIVASIRALLLQRTVAIWHRPKTSASGGGPKQYAKYYGAKVINLVPLVALISVQNLQLEPEIAKICKDWIYQFAQWYPPLMTSKRDDEVIAFVELIRQHANGRPTIIYLGEVTPEKGFGFFTDLLLEDRCAEFAFVAAGKVSQRSEHAVQRFKKAGGLVVDRYISDSEFVGGIDIADWVWSCYRPDNDQNSGIFGNAYRAGARVIVRSDSYISRVALDLQFPTVPIQFGDVRRALEAIRASRTLMVEKPKQEMISIMKERTCERLLYYLGCSRVNRDITPVERTDLSCR